MNIICLDFESFYGDDLGFKKQTNEEYVRDPRFEVIGVAVKVNQDATIWHTGTHAQIERYLRNYDWGNSLLLAHNTMFDGFILTQIFNIIPKGYLDTLSMARALHGVDVGGSLAFLAEKYNIGVKGNEVVEAYGKRREDFTPQELAAYGSYCRNDTELCRKLFDIFMEAGFPKKELKVIDLTIRMAAEPVLELDLPLLEEHLHNVVTNKQRLLDACVADKDTLMSNDKFAELLKQLGVEPPTKISLRTGKEAWAFAKTDPGFKELAEHPDVRVQVLSAARLGNKTTLEETRTQRFIDIAKRGKFPIPLRYFATHTGRWGGSDKINLQNLPARGSNKLKQAIKAPPGYVIIDCDSSQIEARVVAWLAGQRDLVEAFAAGKDVYKQMASKIYNVPEDKVSKEERFVGKTTILGASYGLGAAKFQVMLKASTGIDLPIEECREIVKIYRASYPAIPKLWAQAQKCLEGILTRSMRPFGAVDVVKFEPHKNGFLLPSGLMQRYPGLSKHSGANGYDEYTYQVRKGVSKIYGSKCVENLCQGIARCIIAEQMVLISKKYRVVLTVHDAVACIVPKEEQEAAIKYVQECMRWVPEWATGLPLNCEAGVGDNYGEC